MRASPSSTSRPPSPAEPALPNTADIVAGEGPGVGEQQVVVPAMARERFRDRQRVPPLPRDPLRPTQPTPSRGRGRGWGNIKLSFGRWHANGFAIDSASPLSRETRSAKHSRHRRGGGAGGGGTSSCRPGDDMRAVSRSTSRPPSPARPAPPNTDDIVAGEGPGVGEHQVVVLGDGMRTVSPSTTRPLIRPSGTFPRRGKAPL